MKRSNFHHDGINTYDATILHDSIELKQVLKHFNEADPYFKAEIMIDLHTDLLRFGQFTLNEDRQGRTIFDHMNSNAVPENRRKREVSIVVIDKNTKLIANYFCLRLLTDGFALRQNNGKPLLELRYFLNNNNFKDSKTKRDVPKLGKYVFEKLIMPMMTEFCEVANADTVFAMSINKSHLVRHYISMGFSKASGLRGILMSALLKAPYTHKCRLITMPMKH